MTSMLFSVSMVVSGGRGPGAPAAPPLLLRGLLDVLAHHVLVGCKPVGHLLELPALHLPDLNEAASFVVGRRDLERRYQTAQGEVRDLLEPGLRVVPGELAVGLGLQCVADGLHVEGSDQHAAVVEHRRDRKSTRLNSSHITISYAVFCLKKKNISTQQPNTRNYDV